MLRNKKGSVTVLVLLIFLSVISAVMVFVNASKQLAIKSLTKELGLMWSESILGEYDLNLQGRYGIFAFEGIEYDVNSKFDFYAGESFKNKKYIKYEGTKSSLYNYSLGNLQCLKKQVIKEGKCVTLNKKYRIKEIKAAKNAETIRPSKVNLSELPSAGLKNNFDFKSTVTMIKKLKSIKAIAKSGSDIYFENKYIEKYFKNYSTHKNLGKTFFDCEEEYILNGGSSDSENQKITKRKLIILRSAMNLAYLQTDKVKQAETFATAELLTPGVFAAGTQKAIQAAWALAEARNDYMLLINGKKVPLFKTKQSWATDLKELTKGMVKSGTYGRRKGDIGHIKDRNGDSGKSLDKKDFNKKLPYIEINNNSGEIYEDYIFVMLFLMNEDTKLVRMMDIIEANMKIGYYGGFNIKRYNTGIEANIKLNGGNYVVKKEYTP